MKEQWKPVPIPEYETRYEISNRGQVRSLITNGRGSNSRQSKTQMMKPCNTGEGYRRVGLFLNPHVRLFRIHRLVAMAFLPPPRKDRITVNHLNGNKADNRVENLEWATMHEQNIHKYKELGIQTCRGTKNGSAKLTEAQVRKIRALHKPRKHGYGYGALAKQFGVSKVTVCRIIKGKLWKYLLTSSP